MNIISLYECEICGKQSKNETKIKNHEKQCKAENMKKIEIQNKKNAWEKEFLETFHPSKLKECVNSYLEKFGEPTFENLEFELVYSENVSNSHSAPINGVENWGGKEGLPKGYPGFQGRITGEYNSIGKSISEYCGAFYNKVKIPGIYTGSGGGGGGTFGYQFQFFIDDFPNFKKEFEYNYHTEKAKCLLTGENFKSFVYRG